MSEDATRESLHVEETSGWGLASTVAISLMRPRGVTTTQRAFTKRGPS